MFQKYDLLNCFRSLKQVSVGKTNSCAKLVVTWVYASVAVWCVILLYNVMVGKMKRNAVSFKRI